MGVKGLWSLLNPVARPVQIESLEGKRLAIDSSIWLYQFQSTMRDKDGRVLVNAHILGFLRRINRLLFHGIKPVFVFDGGAPALKRSTIAERKRRKVGAQQNHAKMAEKLLAAQMRREAVRLAQEAEARRAARAAERATMAMDDEEGEQIRDNAVYLDELEGRPAPARSSQTNAAANAQTNAPASLEETPEQRRQRFKKYDRYQLPEVEMPSYSTEARPDARLATEAELQQFIEEVAPEDIDVESPEFRALPTEVQYEIIGDLRVRSRQPSGKRLTDMLSRAPTALDFSKEQIRNLSQRNDLTQKLLTVTDMVGSAHLTIPVRVASERNRQYLLVKRGEEEGGGWALGIREGTQEKPIELEPDSKPKVAPPKVEASDDEDSDELQEVTPVDEDLRQHRRREILEAIAKRYAPTAPLKTLDVPAKSFGPAPKAGAKPLFESNEEEAEDDIVPTANDEALALALQQEELGSDEEEADPALARALALSRREAPPKSPSVTDSDEFEEVSVAPSGSQTPHEAIVIDDSDEDFEVMEEVAAPLADRLGGASSEPRGEGGQRPGSTSFAEAGSAQSVMAALGSRRERPTVTAGHRPGVSKPPDVPLLSTHSSTAPSAAPVQNFVTPRTSGDTSKVNDVSSSKQPEVPPSISQRAPASEPPSSPEPRPAEGSPVTDSVDVEGVASPPGVDGPSPSRGAPSPASVVSEAENARGIAATLPSDDDEDDLVEVTTEPEETLDARAPPAEDAVGDSSPDITQDGTAPTRPAHDSEDEDEDDLVEVSTEPEETLDDRATPSEGVSEAASPDSTQDITHPTRNTYDSEEEDEDAIPWSRSPTPAAREEAPGDSSMQSIDSGLVSDGEMNAAEMEQEEDDYARFIAQIKNRDLNEVRTEIDDEIRILNQNTKAAMRDSDEITQSMVVQVQTLLKHFGIPYITAPMEAEAQCAKLAELELVDGIITDDSDVFLFGGTHCFKNIFNEAKYAEVFAATDIERELSLTRERLISLSYLLGSDYTIGLPGVGPVMALELLANFPGPDGLERFKEWWMKVQRGQDMPGESETNWRRRFKKRFSGTLFLTSDWLNPHVREAYLHPTTDESDEPFHWGFPRLAALRTYLHEELSWSITKVDDELTPIVQRIAQRGRGGIPRQSTLLPFFDHNAAAGTNFAPRRRTTANVSKRLLSVIKDYREAEARAQGQQPTGLGEMLSSVDQDNPKGTVKRSNSKVSVKGTESDDESVSGPPKPKRRKSGPRRKTLSRATTASSAGVSDAGDVL